MSHSFAPLLRSHNASTPLPFNEATSVRRCTSCQPQPVLLVEPPRLLAAQGRNGRRAVSLGSSNAVCISLTSRTHVHTHEREHARTALIHGGPATAALLALLQCCSAHCVHGAASYSHCTSACTQRASPRCARRGPGKFDPRKHSSVVLSINDKVPGQSKYYTRLVWRGTGTPCMCVLRTGGRGHVTAPPYPHCPPLPCAAAGKLPSPRLCWDPRKSAPALRPASTAPSTRTHARPSSWWAPALPALHNSRAV